MSPNYLVLINIKYCIRARGRPLFVRPRITVRKISKQVHKNVSLYSVTF